MQQNFTWDSINQVFLPLIIGGLSGCTAMLCVKPQDMVVLRMQLRSEAMGKARPFMISTKEIMKEIYHTSGVTGFYKGFSFACVRQLFQGMSRFGTYKSIMMNYEKTQGTNPSFLVKTVSSLFGGLMGSIISNPMEIGLVRTQSDSILPLSQRRNYKGPLNALKRIVKEEGFLKLWKGCFPAILRNMVINFSMLIPYDIINTVLEEKQGKSKFNHMIAASSAGVIAAVCSQPFDNIKNKLQHMVAHCETKQLPYRNIRDALKKTIKNEGFMGFWVGYSSYSLRISRYSTVTLMVQESLTQLAQQKALRYQI